MSTSPDINSRSSLSSLVPLLTSRGGNRREQSQSGLLGFQICRMFRNLMLKFCDTVYFSTARAEQRWTMTNQVTKCCTTFFSSAFTIVWLFRCLYWTTVLLYFDVCFWTSDKTQVYYYFFPREDWRCRSPRNPHRTLDGYLVHGHMNIKIFSLWQLVCPLVYFSHYICDIFSLTNIKVEFTRLCFFLV